MFSTSNSIDFLL